MRGRDVLVVLGAAILVVLLLGIMGSGMIMGPWMMHWGAQSPGPQVGWWGLVMVLGMLLFWAVIIGGAIWLAALVLRQGHTRAQRGGHAALDILRQRYARGEITREQFEQMRKDIEGS